MATVIYAIECMENGFAYVGCTSAKGNKRFREHRCLLNNRRHSSSRMVEDWHKYGQQSFALRVLETLPDNSDIPTMREAELRWQKTFSERGLLYNIAIVSFALPEWARRIGVERSRGITGNRWTPEANLKRSLAQKGIPKGHGAKISATKRAKFALLQKLRQGDEIVSSAQN